jgi:large subunit ribosomal protein L25
MRKDITIAAESRDSRGKNAARRLRMKGLVPAVLYGGSAEPAAVSVSPKELSKILSSKTGHNTIFNLGITNQEPAPVMIIDWQYDPIKESLLHVDLKRIDLNQRISVKVPVMTHGDARGVKLQGGLMEVVTREIEIECLPDDIPEQFTVDVAELMLNQSIRASDIPLSGSMKLLSPAEAVIAHVVSVRAEATDTPDAAGAAGSAGDPEVIKKGKKEEAAAEPAKKK